MRAQMIDAWYTCICGRQGVAVLHADEIWKDETDEKDKKGCRSFRAGLIHCWSCGVDIVETDFFNVWK
jgi:hypothetical protein